MLIQRGYKYRILPTKEQEESLLKCGGNVRFLWNYALRTNQDYYKETGKFKFYYELAVSLPKLKEEYPFLKESSERSPSAVMWFTRSAMKAAAMKERQQEWVEAVNVYERVVEAQVPARIEALKRIERIRAENWALFQ